MSNFAQLKNNRKAQFDKLAQAAETVNSTGRQEDTSYWKPTIDKAGNGSAIIRFLPPSNGEDVPFVRYWDHGFQGPGGWYIEKSLTSIGEQDPVGEINTKLWNSGVEADKEIARKQKRRLHYVSNIYVVSDPGNPLNEGKVFKYEYGKKIFDKINEAMHPQFEDEEAVNPFDFWEGANFRLRIRQVEGYRNYDKSSFDGPSPLKEDDSELEAIWNSQHPVQEILDPKNFKSYNELAKKLQRVLGNVVQQTTAEQESLPEEKAWTPPVSEPKQEKVVQDTNWDDDDDSLEFFKKLANE